MYRLFVGIKCTKNRAWVYVENLRWSLDLNISHKRELCTHLYQSAIVSSYNKFTIWSDTSTACYVLEPWYCFGYFLGTRRVNLHSSRSSHGIPVWFGRWEVNRRDWGILFDEDRMLKLPPVSWFCIMFWGTGARMGLNNNWLVVHSCQKQKCVLKKSSTTCSSDRLRTKFQLSR